jgi:hypothetical protein
VAGVSDYVVVNYEIVDQDGNVVVAKITYSSKSGNDIVQTKRFKVQNGRLYSLDPNEIRDSIRNNLIALRGKLWGRLEHWGAGCSDGESISIGNLLGEDHLLDNFNETYAVNGENYNTIIFRKIDDLSDFYSGGVFTMVVKHKYEASVTDQDGDIVHIYYGVSGCYLQ